MEPEALRCVAPSRLAVGEPFALKIKVLGPPWLVPASGNFADRKPALRSPFNLNSARRIQYHDNTLPEWHGRLRVDAGPDLAGPEVLVFDGRRQGVFPGDTRPIQTFPGFRFSAPGFHFIRLIDAASGIEGISAPIHVTVRKPAQRLYWGDPHWQTFFSDGIRCPEELYAFARDEAFLDFGAITDHMEAVTDRQWDYFQAVANDYNQAGRFATLIGQEWTHHNRERGAPGHRNIYFRGRGGPALRSTDLDCDTLEKLWRKLDALGTSGILAVPHHSANEVMGVDWDQGWNARYEKAVEIYSVWGNSERHADDGNPMPIEHCKGERRGRHVIDALRRGYRFGFVGGGDIHDGRPGDPLREHSLPPRKGRLWPSGYTAVYAPRLSRAAVFDAMAGRRTYATTQSRIYLDVAVREAGPDTRLVLSTASEEGLRRVEVVVNGDTREAVIPEGDARVLERKRLDVALQAGDFCYVRVTTAAGHMAWSSPFWKAGA